MDILIVRDGGATKIPKQVDDMDAVHALRGQGFDVEVVGGEPEPEPVAQQNAPEA